ncbi:hypothetical protein DVH05_027438 [Phytophthora capsici]|nr:hypothetical protein DVH05_027438 [Phytophthora capsici]
MLDDIAQLVIGEPRAGCNRDFGASESGPPSAWPSSVLPNLCHYWTRRAHSGAQNLILAAT